MTVIESSVVDQEVASSGPDIVHIVCCLTECWPYESLCGAEITVDLPPVAEDVDCLVCDVKCAANYCPILGRCQGG